MPLRHDPARIAELQRIAILDSSPERAYDDITRLLATTLAVPITMVNLLDEERDWFKSCVGLQQTQSPKVTSFYSQILLSKPLYEALRDLDATDEAKSLDAARRNRLPKAVIIVHLYGQCVDLDPILAACQRHGVALIEDAAEAVGSFYKGRHAGSLGHIGILSFNGNKIMTTSGGGMLLANDGALVAQARFLATQARDQAPHYQHSTIGFNYRLSNVLAGIGRGQLARIEAKVAARRRIFDLYHRALGDIPGITFMPEATFGDPRSRANRWLTCLLIDPVLSGTTRETVRLALDAANIESRPLWKPLHLQPVFTGCRMIGGAVCERLFERGLCLPSGSAMTDEDVARVVGMVRGCCRLEA